MNLLVATPTVRAKDYSFERWHDAVQKLGVDYLMCDNSEDEEYVLELRDRGVWAVRLDPEGPFKKRFNDSWRVIWQIADDAGYDYILSLEADVIAPVGILEVMEENYHGCDFLRHSYPWRYPSEFKCYGMGCTLGGIEQWWYALASCKDDITVNANLSNFRCKDIDILPLEHLDNS